MAIFEPKPFGKYFLTEKLAVGGMAEIYKAKTFGVDGFEKLLSIKKILPHCSADKEFISMLTDEAKLVVRLSHTNIVQIYDLGKVGDDYYISMEFIDGVNLRELINRGKELKTVLPIPLCLYIISEVCKGLDYAHSKMDENSRPLHIVHRDISPQNILLSFEGETKIVDFGIAKAAMNISQTSAGMLKGKVSYMSPEQALGKTIDHRTDIFSTGLILCELLTGNKLFTGETQLQVLKQIQTTQITFDMLPQNIPPDIRHILAKALTYSPKNRLETAGDFQIALTKILYSQYNDFSPKQLSLLIQKWFATELKIKRKQAEAQASIDTQTREALNQSRQESIVHHEPSLSSKASQFLDTTKPEDENNPLVFKHEPPPKSVHPLPFKSSQKTILPRILYSTLAFLILLLVVMGGLYFFKKPPPLGSLSINSEPPGAHIAINNETKEEETPALIDQLPINTSYSIRLTKEGFKEWNQEVLLKDRKIYSLSATLVPLEIKGALFITTEPPEATLKLDGVEQPQKTPLTLNDLAADKEVDIELTREGFQPIHVKAIPTADKTLELFYKLEKLSPEPIKEPLPEPVPKTPLPTLQIKSNLVSAKVYINNTFVGVSPYTYEGSPGNFKIRLEKEGYLPSEQSAPLADGENKTITFQLKREEAPVVGPKPQPEPHITPPSQDTGVGGVVGRVRFDSTPRGAAVIFNGAKSGITPIWINSVEKNKRHSVVMTHPGYKTWSYSFELNKNYIEVTATLQKE